MDKLRDINKSGEKLPLIMNGNTNTFCPKVSKGVSFQKSECDKSSDNLQYAQSRRFRTNTKPRTCIQAQQSTYSTNYEMM
uniref:Uncharacterized protein n=1 Tax=Glossina palpalis gambiensis TaxID=67801 RepID=A0A1B0ASG8_9MUSC